MRAHAVMIRTMEMIDVAIAVVYTRDFKPAKPVLGKVLLYCCVLHACHWQGCKMTAWLNHQQSKDHQPYLGCQNVVVLNLELKLHQHRYSTCRPHQSTEQLMPTECYDRNFNRSVLEKPERSHMHRPRTSPTLEAYTRFPDRLSQSFGFVSCDQPQISPTTKPSGNGSSGSTTYCAMPVIHACPVISGITAR